MWSNRRKKEKKQFSFNSSLFFSSSLLAPAAWSHQSHSFGTGRMLAVLHEQIAKAEKKNYIINS